MGEIEEDFRTNLASSVQRCWKGHSEDGNLKQNQTASCIDANNGLEAKMSQLVGKTQFQLRRNVTYTTNNASNPQNRCWNLLHVFFSYWWWPISPQWAFGPKETISFITTIIHTIKIYEVVIGLAQFLE